MIKKVDFTRTGDCQKVMDFVLSLDTPMDAAVVAILEE